jgi:23S rRNA (cytosine1962-C5)-methyltransferase
VIRLQISKGLQKKIRSGYPWVFKYQILNGPIKGNPGDLGVVYDSDNRFLAVGLIDPEDEICFRVLQRSNPIAINESFWEERFKNAVSIREPLKNFQTDGYRVLNGENDGFPGLVLDRYGESGVLKIYSTSWIPYLKTLSDVIQKQLTVKRVVIRLARKINSICSQRFSVREGDLLFGESLNSSVRFLENGLTFEADILAGQKTGFYFDQRENRETIRELALGKTTLNVFCYTGGFSVYALAGKCKSVLEIDSNPWALESGRKNVELNFSDPKTVANFFQKKGDAFQELEKLKKEKQSFDIVILDPPAFARKKKEKPSALNAYLKLVKIGTSLVKKGGVLFAASCSAPVFAEEFFEIVIKGVRDTGSEFSSFKRSGHALDHPISFKEGAYLKGIFGKVN